MSGALLFKIRGEKAAGNGHGWSRHVDTVGSPTRKSSLTPTTLAGGIQFSAFTVPDKAAMLKTIGSPSMSVTASSWARRVWEMDCGRSGRPVKLTFGLPTTGGLLMTGGPAGDFRGGGIVPEHAADRILNLIWPDLGIAAAGDECVLTPGSAGQANAQQGDAEDHGLR